VLRKTATKQDHKHYKQIKRFSKTHSLPTPRSSKAETLDGQGRGSKAEGKYVTPWKVERIDRATRGVGE
jgi:hypothetical protein